MSENDKNIDYLPLLQNEIEKLLASDSISEELKIIAIQKVQEIVDRHIKAVE